jgi:glycosyltransferase involved in cell wall biosynthesis
VPTVRVVMVIPSLLVADGGLERVATTLAVGVAAHVDRLVVCYAEPGEFEEPLREAGAELVRIRRPRPLPHRLVPASIDLARVLERERPDVVHAHNPAAGVAARLARIATRTERTGIVASFHGVHLEYAAFTRLAVRAADVVVGVGPTSTRGLQLPPGRAVTILNAVVDAPVRPRDAVRAELGATDAELVVHVGRYVPLKNQALLLEALARIAPRRPRLRAVLVGDGELRAELEQRARQLGLGDVVSVLGPRTDAVDVIAAGDVFALSSDSEALPLTLLEAMTHGRPVCSTAVGSIPDLVADGQTGLLVPPRDAAALAEAIERLLDDPALAERLGAAGRAAVLARYSVGTMVERTLAVYESVAASRERRYGSRG